MPLVQFAVREVGIVNYPDFQWFEFEMPHMAGHEFHWTLKYVSFYGRCQYMLVALPDLLGGVGNTAQCYQVVKQDQPAERVEVMGFGYDGNWDAPVSEKYFAQDYDLYFGKLSLPSQTFRIGVRGETSAQTFVSVRGITLLFEYK